METSKDLRKEFYEFLDSIGIKLNNIHHNKIKQFLLKHTETKMVEMANEIIELKSLNNHLTNLNKQRKEAKKEVKVEPKTMYSIPKNIRNTYGGL